MTKLEAIAAAKTFRRDADEILQRMKEHKKALCRQSNDPRQHPAAKDISDDLSEVIAQHTLAIRDLESCIMRLGMSLKYIGNPNPYPESYNPASPVVEPTADDLKM